MYAPTSAATYITARRSRVNLQDLVRCCWNGSQGFGSRPLAVAPQSCPPALTQTGCCDRRRNRSINLLLQRNRKTPGSARGLLDRRTQLLDMPACICSATTAGFKAGRNPAPAQDIGWMHLASRLQRTRTCALRAVELQCPSLRVPDAPSSPVFVARRLTASRVVGGGVRGRKSIIHKIPSSAAATVCWRFSKKDGRLGRSWDAGDVRRHRPVKGGHHDQGRDRWPLRYFSA